MRRGALRRHRLLSLAAAVAAVLPAAAVLGVRLHSSEAADVHVPRATTRHVRKAPAPNRLPASSKATVTRTVRA
ncbi:MAG TPA: hypothetical protein VGP69_03950 [Gaiellaceae bacterium]|nr:hypothetical protein [Gaiellaceae bacterium]